MKKSQLFQECFGIKNLKEAYFYARNNLNSSNFSSLPFGSGIADIIEIYGDSFFEALSEIILTNGTYEPDKACYMLARKDASFGIRPICLPSFIDRLLYQAILNRCILGNIIEDRLLDICFANRINRIDTSKSLDDFFPHDFLPEDFIQNYKIPFLNYEGAIRKSREDGYIHLARLDIEGFFENININLLQKDLLADFGAELDVVEILIKILKKWTEFEDSNLGIPQGLDPSGVLANAFLDSLDRAIANKYGDTVRYFRYSDDITLLAEKPEILYECVGFAIQHLRNKALKSNSKSGVYLNITEEKLETLLKMISMHEPGKIYSSSILDIESVFNDIDCQKMPSVVHKSGVSYYLKGGYYGNKDYNRAKIKQFALLLEKYPLVMNSLFHFFLKPEIEFFKIHIPINESVVYKEVFALYKNGYLSSWQRFSILKLLCYSLKSVKNDDFYNFILQEFKNLNDIYQQVLFLKFSFEEGSENENIKNLLTHKNLKVFIAETRGKGHAPVILSTVFWIFRHEHELIKSDIQNYSSHQSLELQIITYHFSQIYGIKIHNIEQKGALLRRLHGIKVEGKDTPQGEIKKTNTISIDIRLLMEKKEDELAKNKKFKSGEKKMGFDVDTGIVTFKDNQIGVIKPKNREFYFFEFLYTNFNLPMKHAAIAKYVQEKSKSYDSKGKNIGEVKSYCSTIKGLLDDKIQKYIHAPAGSYQLLEIAVTEKKKGVKKKTRKAG